MPTDFIYETAQPKSMTLDRMQLLEHKGAYLLIVNQEIVLKYKVIYKLPYTIVDSGVFFKYIYTLEIDELELEPFDFKDKETIEKETKEFKKECDKLTE